MIGGVVLAGGAGRRMGGVDKAALAVGGVTLLDRVLRAARPVCDHLVVVGPVRHTAVEGVVFVTEREPGGGPVPAVRAGLDAVGGCEIVLVLAVDLALVGSDHLRVLVEALQDPHLDAAAALDPAGPNPLLAAYRASSLRGLDFPAGSAAKRLLPPRTVAADLGPVATLNVNYPQDVGTAERLLAPDS